MEKKELMKIIDNVLKLNGFNKKGNSWYSENDTIIKKVDIQKSKFGNNYYLNYGFILKRLELDRLEMHIFNQLSSVNDAENKRIMELLNFENGITDERRENELKIFIEQNMVNILNKVNSETDIVNELKKHPHLNDVPLNVKKYLNLD